MLCASLLLHGAGYVGEGSVDREGQAAQDEDRHAPEDDLGRVRAAREAIMPHVHSSAFTQAHQRRMVDAL
jgi:hypothetical protein